MMIPDNVTIPHNFEHSILHTSSKITAQRRANRRRVVGFGSSQIVLGDPSITGFYQGDGNEVRMGLKREYVRGAEWVLRGGRSSEQR